MLMHEPAAARGQDMVELSLEGRALAGAAIGVAVIGADDRIEYCNAQYPKLWGLPSRGPIDAAGVQDSASSRARMNGILFRQDAQRTRSVVRLGNGRSLELVTVSVREPARSGLRRVMFVREVTREQQPERRRFDHALACVAGVLALSVAALAVSPEPGPAARAPHQGPFALAALDHGPAAN